MEGVCVLCNTVSDCLISITIFSICDRLLPKNGIVGRSYQSVLNCVLFFKFSFIFLRVP